MGDESSPAATGTFVFNLREIISEVRRVAKERKADSPEPLGVENEHVGVDSYGVTRTSK